MTTGKRILIMLLVLVVFAAAGAGILWHMRNYTMVDFRFYPKGIQTLDLRGQEVSLRHYEKLLRRMPDTKILWDVPFSGGTWNCGAETIAVTALTDEDVQRMDYLTELRTVRAESCTDYPQLLALMQRRPELTVTYRLRLEGREYDNQTKQVELYRATEETVSQLDWLPELEEVICGGAEPEAARQLQQYCRDRGLTLSVRLGERILPDTTRELTLTGVTEEELTLLSWFPQLETLYLVEPKVEAQTLLQLRQTLSQAAVDWERTCFDQLWTTQTREADLSGVSRLNLARLREALDYFPQLEQVFLGMCGLDNEELAAFREEYRGRCKVVWEVQLGKHLTARTDDTTFMPIREEIYYFQDHEAENLRYCEDMICVDVGHMSISDIGFVAHMPNLQYLVLAHTQVQYIEPLRSCKNLKFLELDWSPIKDYSPLVECTGLEDLNLGNTYADFAPIAEMTWLENLWMIGCSRRWAYLIPQSLTETNVVVSGKLTVSNGWRELDNYYAMRDLLGMEYMEG